MFHQQHKTHYTRAGGKSMRSWDCAVVPFIIRKHTAAYENVNHTRCAHTHAHHVAKHDSLPVEVHRLVGCTYTPHALGVHFALESARCGNVHCQLFRSGNISTISTISIDARVFWLQCEGIYEKWI